MRPVFADTDLSPKAVVVVHQLKIEVHSNAGGHPDSHFFALDRNDLLTLRSVIDRALAKHEALRALADGLELPVLESWLANSPDPPTPSRVPSPLDTTA
jgi:hypothetical protein